MTCVTVSPATQTRSRRIAASPSSGGDFGLAADDIYISLSPARREISQAVPSSDLAIENQIFESLAKAKIWTSQVAMHMKLTDRNRFFRQLDRLHDIDEWMGEDQPVRLESYKSFVRFMLAVGTKSKPALALSHAGILLAIWQSDSDRLTVEFSPDGHVEWVVSNSLGAEFERAAGRTQLHRLMQNLTPYEPGKWLDSE